MSRTPNDEIFGQASQTRTANEIFEAKVGRYNPTPRGSTGNAPPPERFESFTLTHS